jgi:hypothetical protein
MTMDSLMTSVEYFTDIIFILTLFRSAILATDEMKKYSYDNLIILSLSSLAPIKD